MEQEEKLIGRWSFSIPHFPFTFPKASEGNQKDPIRNGCGPDQMENEQLKMTNDQ